MVNVKVEIANEQLRDDARLRGCEAARLRGGSIIEPCAKVPRQNESRSDVT